MQYFNNIFKDTTCPILLRLALSASKSLQVNCKLPLCRDMQATRHTQSSTCIKTLQDKVVSYIDTCQLKTLKEWGTPF